MKTLEEVVDEVIQEFIRDSVLFTALDVSNKVKQTMPFARHREVRDLIRGAFMTTIEPAGYARTPITVTLADGSNAEALLYHSLADTWDLDTKYSDQQRNKFVKQTVPTVSNVTGVTASNGGTVTVMVAPTNPLPALTVTPVAARIMWDNLFQSQPSLFPRK